MLTLGFTFKDFFKQFITPFQMYYTSAGDLGGSDTTTDDAYDEIGSDAGHDNPNDSSGPSTGEQKRRLEEFKKKMAAKKAAEAKAKEEKRFEGVKKKSGDRAKTSKYHEKVIAANKAEAELKGTVGGKKRTGGILYDPDISAGVDDGSGLTDPGVKAGEEPTDADKEIGNKHDNPDDSTGPDKGTGLVDPDISVGVDDGSGLIDPDVTVGGAPISSGEGDSKPNPKKPGPVPTGEGGNNKGLIKTKDELSATEASALNKRRRAKVTPGGAKSKLGTGGGRSPLSKLGGKQTKLKGSKGKDQKSTQQSTLLAVGDYFANRANKGAGGGTIGL